MNHYETVFILNPVLSEDQVKEAVQKYTDIITSNEGELVDQEDWGLKKFAYTIQNKKSGFYQCVTDEKKHAHFNTTKNSVEARIQGDIANGRFAPREFKHQWKAIAKNAAGVIFYEFLINRCG